MFWDVWDGGPGGPGGSRGSFGSIRSCGSSGFDDPQVFQDPKGISIGSMDLNNPKVDDDTSIFDGLVYC